MNNLLVELAGLAGLANAALYIGGFLRKLENERQAEASKQNARIATLEGEVNVLINGAPIGSKCQCDCHKTKPNPDLTK